jgi:TonB-dependent starch-binding outer membrane protein SusC
MVHTVTRLFRSSWPALAAILLLLAPIASAAQEKAVLQGVVADQISGNVIDAARITLVGRGQSARTESDGIFVLPEVEPGVVTIRTEAAGYPPVVEEIEVGPGLTIMQITMLSMAAILDGFVVTGTRSSEHGSVASGDSRTAADLLLTQMPGVSTKKGMVGKNDSQILLRGVNSIYLSSEPMLFIDGIRIAGGIGQAMDALSHIPATDVKEIRVMRGVSASFIEGSANGVIYVQTRSGLDPKR